MPPNPHSYTVFPGCQVRLTVTHPNRLQHKSGFYWYPILLIPSGVSHVPFSPYRKAGELEQRKLDSVVPWLWYLSFFVSLMSFSAKHYPDKCTMCTCVTSWYCIWILTYERSSCSRSLRLQRRTLYYRRFTLKYFSLRENSRWTRQSKAIPKKHTLNSIWICFFGLHNGTTCSWCYCDIWQLLP